MDRSVVVTNSNGDHEVRIGRFIFDTFFGRFDNALEQASKFADRINDIEGDIDLVDFYADLNNDFVWD